MQQHIKYFWYISRVLDEKLEIKKMENIKAGILVPVKKKLDTKIMGILG